jgi:hypothetical protein
LCRFLRINSSASGRNISSGAMWTWQSVITFFVSLKQTQLPVILARGYTLSW